MAHSVLPTADHFTRFGMHMDPLCHCGQQETLRHLFVECAFATQVIRWYHSIVQQCLPSSMAPTPKQILVGYSRNCGILPVFQCRLGIVHHHLWKAGNAARWDKVTPVPHATTLQIKLSLRFAIRTQQHHC